MNNRYPPKFATGNGIAKPQTYAKQNQSINPWAKAASQFREEEKDVKVPDEIATESKGKKLQVGAYIFALLLNGLRVKHLTNNSWDVLNHTFKNAFT